MNPGDKHMLSFANHVSAAAAFILYVSVAIWLKHLCSVVPCHHACMTSAMASEEGEWVDGEVASAPHSTSGHQIIWQVGVGTTNGAMTWADFKAHECLRMDAGVGAGDKTVTLKLHDDTWTIDLENMLQINDGTGTKRPIRRVVVVKRHVFTP